MRRQRWSQRSGNERSEPGNSAQRGVPLRQRWAFQSLLWQPRVSARHGRIAQWAALYEQPLEQVACAARRAEEDDAGGSTAETRAARFQSLLNLAFARGFHATPPQPAVDASPRV